MLLGMTGDGKESWMDCGRPCCDVQHVSGLRSVRYFLPTDLSKVELTLIRVSAVMSDAGEQADMVISTVEVYEMKT